MADITRRRLIGGGAIALGGILTAIAFRSGLALKIRHEFETPLTVSIDVTHPDTGEYEYNRQVRIGPTETKKIEFGNVDTDQLEVQVVSERGGGSYRWNTDSSLEVVMVDGGVEFDT